MNKQAKTLLGIVVVVSIICVGLALIAKPKSAAPGTPADASLLMHPDSHMTTTADAKVQIVEFGDYECPACGAAYPIMKQILATYANNPNVNFVFRNYPLPMHPNAPIGAEAAEAAAAQGKFWEMHDMLYEKQGEWGESPVPLTFFVQYAGTLGLDVQKFTADVQANAFAGVIKADQTDGDKLGIDSTPTFYVNGVKFDQTATTWQQFEKEFTDKIAALLKQ